MHRVIWVALMASVVSAGSADIDEAMSVSWTVYSRSVDFILTFNQSVYPESKWWALSISKEQMSDVYRFNETGLDSSHLYKDCCKDARMNWNEVSDDVHRIGFTRGLTEDGCCLPLVHGDTYHLLGLYGRYEDNEPVEVRQTPKAVPIALTNQYTTRQELSPTLNYVVALAAFMGLLYIAA